MRNLRALLILACSLCLCLAIRAQDYVPSFVVHPNQQILLQDLHLRAAASSDSADVFVAALETALNDPNMCCGEDSAFLEMKSLVDRASLPEIARALNGKHHNLPNGEPVFLIAHFLSGTSVDLYHIQSEIIVSALTAHRAFLIQWNSRIFVVNGVIFDEKVYSDGHRGHVIHKLLLLDPTAVNDTKKSFDRQKDNWSQVTGFLMLSAGNKPAEF